MTWQFLVPILCLIPLAQCQQTFQNTIFDLPAQLGGEPVGVAAQSQSGALYVQRPDIRPPPLPHQVPSGALPQAAVATTPLPAFTFPTLPTVAALPTHPPLPTFTLPTHPTLPPFNFPTHPPLVFTTPYVPPSPYAFVPQQPQQPQPQYNGYPQQYNNNNNNNQYYQQPQQPVYPPQPQQQQQGYEATNYNNYNNQAPAVAAHQPTHAQSFERNSQVVQPVVQQNFAAHVVPEIKQNPVVNAVPTQLVDVESAKKASDFNKATSTNVKSTSIQKAALDAEVDANIDRHLWFNADYDVTPCRSQLNGIGMRFQKKFPSYLQKGGKDRELAELVEQRLLECERKSTASHWDKVDTLLQKIKLTKSEEGECRAGLIQERISCVNLLKYACQFVDTSYHFKLVPARITIQEARQAESGADKCRQVIRIVKQRLESGAVAL